MNDDFLRLVNAYYDGQATESELNQLQLVLKEDAQARRTFRRMGTIVDRLGREPELAATPQTTVRSRSWSWFAVAASLLLALGGITYQAFQPSAEQIRSVEADAVAVITNSDAKDGVRQDGRVNHVGDGLRLGLWTLPDGRTEVRLDSGVELALIGPGAFDLIEPDVGYLSRGQIFARVPGEAIGFRIETDSLRVIDLGTEFAVNADVDGQSAVHVFEGEVQLVGLHGSTEAGDRRLLTEGQTSRVDQLGRSVTESDPGPAEFARPEKTVKVQPTGQVRWLNRPPPSLRAGQFEHDYILAFAEAKNISLPHDLDVIAAVAGRIGDGTPQSNLDHSVLPAGTKVDSYLIHADALSRRLFASGTLRFPGRVLGLLLTNRQLHDTDALLGHPELTYPTGDIRGIELGLPGRIGRDNLVLDRHVRGMAVSLRINSGVDQIRVLVQPTPFSTNPSFAPID